MGHYDECREGYCGKCGQTEGNCEHTKGMKGLKVDFSDVGKVVDELVKKQEKKQEKSIKKPKAKVKKPESAVKAPKLSDLKSRQCSPEELQLALIQVIELHNDMVAHINNLIRKGQIRSSFEVMLNTPYGL